MIATTLIDTTDEAHLRDTVRRMLVDRCPPTALMGLYEGDNTVTSDVWSALMYDLGVAELLIPEEHAGAGATAREAAVVAEELGRACAPGPFLTSAVIATTALVRAGMDGLLEGGACTACLVLPFDAAPGRWMPAVAAREGRLTGSVRWVAGAMDADLLVVPTPTGLYHVDAADPGLRVEPVTSLDVTRPVATVHFDAASGEVAGDRDASDAVDTALLTGASILASEQVGIARWCLDTTIAYLQQRRQFGRILAGYQALKHRLAQLWIRIELSEAAARYAAVCAANGDDDLRIAASVAQGYCSDVAVLAAEECVQLHGGIGMTWEYPAHLYLKRAKADQAALGSAGVHREILAGLVDLHPPAS